LEAGPPVPEKKKQQSDLPPNGKKFQTPCEGSEKGKEVWEKNKILESVLARAISDNQQKLGPTARVSAFD